MAHEEKNTVTSLAQFTCHNLPSAAALNMTQEDWLQILWTKCNKPLNDQEKAWNIPERSDPSRWDEDAWNSFCD